MERAKIDTTSQLHTDDTDELLIDRSLKGEQTATDTLYNRYIPLVDSLLYNVWDEDVQEELQQELGLAFTKAIHRYRPEAGIRFAGYIQNVLNRTKAAFFRHMSHEEDKRTAEKAYLRETASEDQYFRYNTRKLREAVWKLPLSEESKELILLMNQDVTSSVAIAAILDITPEAVRQRRRRMKAKCRTLQEQGLFLDRIEVS